MTIYSRFTPALTVIGLLTFCAASAAGAQDTSGATRPDTSAGYRNRAVGADTAAQAAQPNARSDTSGYKYTGPPTDTALKAKPGAQTGPTAGKPGKAGAAAPGTWTADTVVCKDGSNAPSGKTACKSHGGIDSAATNAALKARGHMGPQPTSEPGPGKDTAKVNKSGASGYQYHGAPSDTALKAKPGTQTGADAGASSRADSGSLNR